MESTSFYSQIDLLTSDRLQQVKSSDCLSNEKEEEENKSIDQSLEKSFDDGCRWIDNERTNIN